MYLAVYKQVKKHGKVVMDTIGSQIVIYDQNKRHKYILVANGQPVAYDQFQTLYHALKKIVVKEKILSLNNHDLLMETKDGYFFLSNLADELFWCDKSFNEIEFHTKAQMRLKNDFDKKKFTHIVNLGAVKDWIK